MKSIAIVLGEGFPLLSLSLVTEPLRVANRESPHPVFRWRLLSLDGHAPRSSSGHEFPVDGPLDEAPADVVLVLASYTPERMQTGPFLAWLRRRAKSGAIMGCVDTGALLLAEAGLLNRRPAAAHHEAISAFRESHGEGGFIDRLFDVNGDRCSSAGGVVTMDMTLALIAHFEDARLARRVAGVLYYRPLGSPEPDVPFSSDLSLPRLGRGVAHAVGLMRAHIETPLQIGDIAGRLGWPDWKLRRAFLRELGRTPQAYYLDLRLERARNLLRNSQEKVETVALMCGFPAAASLSRAYRTRFGVTPRQDRFS